MANCNGKLKMVNVNKFTGDSMATKIILHIASRDAWEDALATGEYRTETLDIDGFIHCSTALQVLKVAERYYCGQEDLMLLCIDRKKVAPMLKYEPPVSPSSFEPSPADTIDLYPHIYGPLNLEAVVMAVEFLPKPDGTFSLPNMVAEIT